MPSCDDCVLRDESHPTFRKLTFQFSILIYSHLELRNKILNSPKRRRNDFLQSLTMVRGIIDGESAEPLLLTDLTTKVRRAIQECCHLALAPIQGTLEFLPLPISEATLERGDILNQGSIQRIPLFQHGSSPLGSRNLLIEINQPMTGTRLIKGTA